MQAYFVFHQDLDSDWLCLTLSRRPLPLSKARISSHYFMSFGFRSGVNKLFELVAWLLFAAIGEKCTM